MSTRDVICEELKMKELMSAGEARYYSRSMSQRLDRIPRIVDVQVYDALEFLICQWYADGPDRRGINKAERAIGRFCRWYGFRHDGKWEREQS